ncbi:hypothetical protein [Variovorax soli]|uniref:Uncharacterized protein n=1 Tax=Variovorax soli TaxID=376815 RepID=A0ABU1N8M5_9BURK|nr:hypothetical protein [Variovorax soli]MDR6534797.1 hypothetical protein [Variovorax soli]
MSAAALIFPERQRPPAAVAFGTLLDLVRLRSEPAEAEVCEACQTINACHARFCKCCDGKLPAYFATVHEDAHPSPLMSAGGDAEARRSRHAVFALVGLWGTVTAVALFLAHGPREAGVPSRPLEHAALPASIERSVARVDPPAAAETARAAQQSLWPVAADVSAAPAPAAAEPIPVNPASEPARTNSRAARASSPPATKPGSVRTAAAASPAARCGGMNFFAHAVCMNNQCARPEMRRSPQCAETLRQQKLGEARRNPKLLG